MHSCDKTQTFAMRTQLPHNGKKKHRQFVICHNLKKNNQKTKPVSRSNSRLKPRFKMHQIHDHSPSEWLRVLNIKDQLTVCRERMRLCNIVTVLLKKAYSKRKKTNKLKNLLIYAHLTNSSHHFFKISSVQSKLSSVPEKPSACREEQKRWDQNQNMDFIYQIVWLGI